MNINAFLQYWNSFCWSCILCWLPTEHWSRHGVVTVWLTRLKVSRSGAQCSAGATDFSLFQSVRIGFLGPTYPHMQWRPAIVSPGVRRPLWEPRHSPLLVATLTVVGALPPLPNMPSWLAQGQRNLSGGREYLGCTPWPLYPRRRRSPPWNPLPRVPHSRPESAVGSSEPEQNRQFQIVYWVSMLCGLLGTEGYSRELLWRWQWRLMEKWDLRCFWPVTDIFHVVLKCTDVW